MDPALKLLYTLVLRPLLITKLKLKLILVLLLFVINPSPYCVSNLMFIKIYIRSLLTVTLIL